MNCRSYTSIQKFVLCLEPVVFIIDQKYILRFYIDDNLEIPILNSLTNDYKTEIYVNILCAHFLVSFSQIVFTLLHLDINTHMVLIHGENCFGY